MHEIYIRERFMKNGSVFGNTYKCDISNIEVELVDTLDDYNTIPDAFTNISLPIISKPLIVDGVIKQINIHIAKDHYNFDEVFDAVKAFISSVEKLFNDGMNLLSLIYNDTIGFKTFYYLYEIEVIN